MFDTEGDQAELNGAIQKARDNKVYLAISDRSFEYWLRLHFGYTTASHDSADELMRELRESGFLPRYGKDGKHPDMEVLFPRLPEAMKNARLVRDNHTSKGYFQPRTDCDLLVDALAAQGRMKSFPFATREFNPQFPSMNRN